MKMAALRFAVVVVLAICVMQCKAQVEYKCSTDASSSMTMTLRALKTTGYQQLLAIDSSTASTNSCISTPVTVDTDEYLQLVITTDAARLQTSPDLATTDCYAVLGSSPTVVDYRIVGQADPLYIQGSDYLLELSCDSDSASGMYVQYNATDITVVTALTSTPITAANFDYVLTLKDNTGTVVSGSTAINAMYMFEVTFTRTNSAAIPLFNQLSLIASASSDYSNPIIMLSTDGCVATTAGDPFHLSAPFDVAGTPVPGTDTSVVALSGTFQMATFVDSLVVYFRLEIRNPCYLATEDACFDVPTHCTSLRRKRSTNENGTANSIELQVNVNLGTSESGSSGLGGNAIDDKRVVNKETCDEKTSFWIVSIVLGVLLLVVLVFTVLLYFRFKRERQNKHVDGNKFGVNNPSF